MVSQSEAAARSSASPTPRRLPTRLASVALLCLSAVIAGFLAYDLRQAVPPYWEGLELYVIPIAVLAAIALWIPREELRLGLVATAIGALLVVGFIDYPQSLGFLLDKPYLRVDALAWGLLALIVTAFWLSWRESRVPWRSAAGLLVIGGVVGAVLAWTLYGVSVIVWLLIHPLTF